jgi:hypothetical protein
MTDRSNWSDARLDDTFHSIERRLISVEGVNVRLASLETEIGFLRSDTHECSAGVQALRDLYDQRIKDRELERKERERDRKSDKRWWVGTVFTAAAFVIAALGLFADKFH